MNTKGKALLEAARPAWAKACIVAHCAVDKSDIQSDYFHVQDGEFHVLAWSRHTRDRFDEMRKAAATFAPTTHLGPGCNEYTPWVVFAMDCKGNGCCYYMGNGSPWHRDLYPPGLHGLHDAPTFPTRPEAEAFIQEKGDPQPIGVDGQLATFRWDIWERKIEHREKYSMGHGYYLRAGSRGGWTVEKTHLEDEAVYQAFAEGRGIAP